MTLRSRLSELAATFADQVIASLEASSLQEIVGIQDSARTGASSRPERTTTLRGAAAGAARSSRVLRASGRLRHRSGAQIMEALERVVTLLRSHERGLRAEEIRVDLGMLSKEMPRVLKEGLAAKKLTSKGHKRATTYFAR
jgi:hypothetical protein